jgi:hypothetical protein
MESSASWRRLSDANPPCPPQASGKRREFDPLEVNFVCYLKFLIPGGADGFEPEISLAELPRTQSETPVPVPSEACAPKTAVNAAKTAHGRLRPGPPSSRDVDRAPGGAERPASVRVGCEFLPIGTPATNGVRLLHWSACSNSRPSIQRWARKIWRPRLERPELYRFLDAGNTEAGRMHRRPASKKRRGTKSREVGRRRSSECYELFDLGHSKTGGVETRG